MSPIDERKFYSKSNKSNPAIKGFMKVNKKTILDWSDKERRKFYKHFPNAFCANINHEDFIIDKRECPTCFRKISINGGKPFVSHLFSSNPPKSLQECGCHYFEKINGEWVRTCKHAQKANKRECDALCKHGCPEDGQLCNVEDCYSLPSGYYKFCNTHKLTLSDTKVCGHCNTGGIGHICSCSKCLNIIGVIDTDGIPRQIDIAQIEPLLPDTKVKEDKWFMLCNEMNDKIVRLEKEQAQALSEYKKDLRKKIKELRVIATLQGIVIRKKDILDLLK